MTDKELAEAYQDVSLEYLEMDINEKNTGIPSIAVSQEACNLMSKCIRRFLEIYGDPGKQKKIDQMQVKLRRINR